MLNPDETTFVLHGLDVDNRYVRGDVFARKLIILINGLRAADRSVNGTEAFYYVVEDLSKRHSTLATLRERPRSRKAALSGIRIYSEVARSVYNGDKGLARFPPALLRHFHNLCVGAETRFSHGEIAFANDNVIRVDDFLIRQAIAATRQFGEVPEGRHARFFSGISHGSFDGTIEEIDARGTMLRGKLIPTGGQAEIDCVMNKDSIPEVTTKFHKRASVSGIVHYSADSALPVRIDVNDIRLLDERGTADLTRWKGAFSSALVGAEGHEW
jgi:hypothetical protein